MDVVAGPFGDPYRAKVPNMSPFNDTKEWAGGFERAVSQLWTSYTTITQVPSCSVSLCFILRLILLALLLLAFH
jgi:hypothetical protein